MYRGLAFYLAPTLSGEEKAELKRLIRQNGGIVSDSSKGATELVAYDALDARNGNRISIDFIKDSVAFRTLQDPTNYSGKIFTAVTKRCHSQKCGERLQYTLEDDARMLHFARMRDWKAMVSVNTWKLAEKEGVTPHSAESMREHFRKQLAIKTPVEQRILMSKAAATIRAQLLEQEDEAEDEQEAQLQEPSPHTRRLTLAGEEPSATLEAMAIEAPVKEVEGQKVSRQRSRKQTTPLQISQRIRASEGDSNESIKSPVPVSTSATATLTTPTSLPTPAVLARPDPSTGKRSVEKQQKRKRDAPPSRIPDQESRSSLQETIESDSEGEGREIDGVYYTSARTTTVNVRNKRPLLQQSFASPSGAESISCEQIDDTSIAGNEEDDNSEPLHLEVQEATEEETDAIVCRLQLETNQDLPAVVHALYYFSGDVEKTKQFLKGASPSDIWCPEDDLLLGNLMAGRVDLSSVDEVLANGAFASLQQPHDSAAILKRVKFLQ